jgi:hypothetical protein
VKRLPKHKRDALRRLIEGVWRRIVCQCEPLDTRSTLESSIWFDAHPNRGRPTPSSGRRQPRSNQRRLAGDTAREATSDEVKELKAEARQLKETLAEVLIENRLLKKSVLGDGENAS